MFWFDEPLTAAHFKHTDNVVSPRAALVFKPAEEYSFYFSYGTSYNPSAENLSLAASNAVYALNDTAALYDVTSGSNGSCGSVCQAGTGYDFVTGLGSPRTGVDLALAGVSGGSSTPTPTSTSAATATPTATSAPPTATATATPTSSGPTATATATTCPPGKQKRGAC